MSRFGGQLLLLHSLPLGFDKRSLPFLSFRLQLVVGYKAMIKTKAPF